ncbi:MAG: isochorismate synthase, partial [Staphylococcus lugdunensis]|nr:isochorismate synthase [Staphylococcus lugdunensis]
MAANLLEDEINHVLYSSNKDWVSVETKLHRELNPSELLQLTEAQAGDRFYLRLND